MGTYNVGYNKGSVESGNKNGNVFFKTKGGYGAENCSFGGQERRGVKKKKTGEKEKNWFNYKDPIFECEGVG